ESPYPFSQLKYVQVVPGIKKNQDRFVVIAGYSPSTDKNLPENVQAGELTSTSFRMVPVYQDNDARLNVEKSAEKKLVPSEVNSRELSNRLAVDQDGNFYWVVKPEIANDDPKFRLLDLFQSKEVYPNGRNKGLKISYGDDAKKAGLAVEEEPESARPDNPWHILAKPDLKRFTEYNFDEKNLKKLQDESKAYPLLAETLDATADPTRPPIHQVIIVTDEQKVFVKQLMLQHYTHRDKGLFRYENQKLMVSIFDPNHATQHDVLQNLTDLADNEWRERAILIADAADLEKSLRPGGEDTETLKGLVESKDISDPSDLPHILDLFSREGRVGSYQEFDQTPSTVHRFSEIILATPTEWERLKKSDEGSGYNLESRFAMNSEFLHSSWRVWPAETSKSKPEIQRFLIQAASPLDYDVFPEPLDTLEKLSDPKVPASHKIYIVPAELKPLFMKVLYRSYAAKNDQARGERKWSQYNTHLKVFHFDKYDATQKNVFLNYRAMHRSATDDRSILIADLEAVKQTGRPMPSEGAEGFLINDPALNRKEENGFVDEPKGMAKQIPPHALWIFDTEGQRISTHDYEKFKQSDRKISTLLIGTEEEWEAIQNDLQLESKFGLAEQYQVARLSPRSDTVRRKLVNQIFQRPEISALNYRCEFDKTLRVSTLDPQAQLTAYLVNRTELLAQQLGQESTTAFMKVLSELTRSLVEDQIFRRTKLMEKSFIERLLTRVFNIPLNLLTLAPDDPQVILNNKREAAFALQNAGYLGPLELKYQFIEALSAQIHGGDSGRNVQSSVIIYGDTSTGKTFLVETLFKVLKLKLYDRYNPNDEAANAMIVKVPDIDPDDIDEEIEHIENFLSLPQGFRGYLFFDDIHKARNEVVLQKLIGFQNRLFEAKDGMLTVKSITTQEEREITVRNITLIESVNPPQDADKRKRFAASNSDVDMIVAALSHKDFPLERSYVARWTDILNVSKFPMDAKGPALHEKLRKSARHDFNLHDRLTIIDPEVVALVTKNFPEANAREFLSSAANHLLQVADRQNLKDRKVSVVVPADRLDTNSRKAPSENYARSSWEGSGLNSSLIGKFVAESMTALPVDQKSLDGRLILLSLMVDSFRTYFYESLVEAIMQDIDYAEDPTMRAQILGPFLHALTANLEERPTVPLKLLNLDPYDFGLSNRTARDGFNDALRRAEWTDKSGENYFPVLFADEFSQDFDVRKLTEPSFKQSAQRSRAHLLADISQKANRLEKQMMSTLLRIDSVDTLPTAEEWLSKIADDDRKEEFQKLGKDTLKLFKEYWAHLFDESFVETTQSENYKQLTGYDAYRLFMIAIDKGMVKMPWASMQNFLLLGLNRVTGDPDFGQRPAIQHYFFESKTSILQPKTHDYVFQMASSSEAYRLWNENVRRDRSKQFKTYCREFLLQVAK
ncbi:MAG: hypothetical protein JWQ35_1292, partial [Bacteriovoracaceae bacterium]|nr:hypothetical protein [Bacteriovoracaceae bacterium]